MNFQAGVVDVGHFADRKVVLQDGQIFHEFQLAALLHVARHGNIGAARWIILEKKPQVGVDGRLKQLRRLGMLISVPSSSFPPGISSTA